ncbi:MAG: hypothetical protein JWM25_1015, partial [Thermoleophilia bacterium]|nr:hypothetical protein [Thermoleophilia bacterium]
MARAIWWDLFENTHTRGVPAIAQARTSGRLRRVANLFAHSFVLQALVQVGPGHSRRTVIKFCLEQSADTSAGIRSIASSDRSLRPGVVAQADLGLGFAESHHVEVAAPVGMRIMEMIVLEPL